MTFSNHILNESSEKVILAHLHATKRLIIFSVYSGAVYSKSVDHFVTSVSDGVTSYSQASSASLNQSEFYFDAESKTLYIRTDNDSDPNTKEIVVTYRFFYSNMGINLPYDLSSGAEVEYLPLVKSSSPISQEIDDEQMGIALETKTTLTMENKHGYFDEIYDTLFFEFKPVQIYAFNPDLAVTESKKIFDGYVSGKTFNDSRVSFNCKDFIYKLREPVSFSNYTSSDGEVPDTYLNTPKRRVYGQFKQLKCVPIDATLDGFVLTGAISGTSGTSTVSGVGTSFLDQLSPEDEIFYQGIDEEFRYSILSVDSDSQITLSENIDESFSGRTVYVNPIRPYRKKNRRWHIAGHKLRQPTTTIASATQPNRVTLTDASDIFANDLIEVDGEEVFVKRVDKTNNNIVFKQNLQAGTPSGGESVVKSPVSKVYANKKELFINRDWTLENTTEGILVFENDAEFNQAKRRLVSGSITFTNGSRQVTATGIDLKNEVRTRDWISSDDITHTTFYEVLSVEEGEIYLRTAYAGGNNTGDMYKKNVNLIDDDSAITVDCLGLERSGVWVNTPALAVKDMLENDASLTNINTVSFTEGDERFPYSLSIEIYDDKIKDVISKINQSCFGSLYNDSDFNLTFGLVLPDKPSTLEVIEDHDTYGKIKVESKTEIYKKIKINYRHFYDVFLDEPTAEFYEFENDFVNNYIGTNEEKEIEIYLYDQVAAETIAQRYSLFYSLSRSIVKFDSKLRFILNGLNDAVYLSFRRLYKRFGNQDRKKLAVINRITKSADGTSIEANDLGNMFNRVPSVLSTGSNDFSSASDDDKLFGGYVVDTDIKVPDTSSEDEYGQNLIG